MAQTRQTIVYSFIRTAISKYTARVYTWRNRVLLRALERLELLDAKVSRAVLRGRDGGNTILLPDTEMTTGTKHYLLRFRENINDPYVYWLADAGRDVLRGLNKDYDFSNWKQPRKMEDYITSQDFTHHMATTDMLIALLLIKNLYPDIQIGDLIHYFRIHADPSIVPIKPDGVAKLTLPDGKPLTLALEVDLGTENEEKIKAKIAGYIPYISDGRFAHDYMVAEVPLIVFYTPTEKRRDTLLTWIEKALLENYSGNKASWFRIGSGELSPGLFFEKIWITPGALKERKVTSLFG